MNQIQYIADGYNKSRERVVLWQLSKFQFQIETAGEEVNYTVHYYDALELFLAAVIEVIHAPEDISTVA